MHAVSHNQAKTDPDQQAIAQSSEGHDNGTDTISALQQAKAKLAKNSTNLEQLRQLLLGQVDPASLPKRNVNTNADDTDWPSLLRARDEELNHIREKLKQAEEAFQVLKETTDEDRHRLMTCHRMEVNQLHQQLEAFQTYKQRATELDAENKELHAQVQELVDLYNELEERHAREMQRKVQLDLLVRENGEELKRVTDHAMDREQQMESMTRKVEKLQHHISYLQKIMKKKDREERSENSDIRSERFGFGNLRNLSKLHIAEPRPLSFAQLFSEKPYDESKVKSWIEKVETPPMTTSYEKSRRTSHHRQSPLKTDHSRHDQQQPSSHSPANRNTAQYDVEKNRDASQNRLSSSRMSEQRPSSRSSIPLSHSAQQRLDAVAETHQDNLSKKLETCQQRLKDKALQCREQEDVIRRLNEHIQLLQQQSSDYRAINTERESKVVDLLQESIQLIEENARLKSDIGSLSDG
ncbi:uncharacterized protein BYT42DRAFT_216748 [Radiomyces spectabilis]|uniref:uncharacterized protein n=1 Tax=Radiomyces spectabilis TaxID=64574 RepID=UPI00221F3309|nr:uncharacterized protein BYT42DRAFT_216748 [Radiomyces spectabilis]KAI8387985.1 hypothetical protein BYT42DRAFT_216748 [Radiomyces spectabilis]